MAFEPLEESIEDGRPLVFYRFSLNDKVWRYTSADATLVKGGFTWEAVPIRDDGANQTGEATQDALRITTVTSIVPADIYMHYPPARIIQVAIFVAHEGDAEMLATYQGEITQFNIPEPGTAVFTCETLSATMQREGLRLGWQRTCPYALYDPVTCKVDKTLFAVAGVVGTVVGNVITVASLAAQPLGRFSGGFLEWIDPVRGLERRGIESHAGASLALFGTSDGIDPGLNVTCYPGCARTTSACISFNNRPNYGGIPRMDGKSPFDGSPVFY